MTDGQARAICNALSLIISELIPVPKTSVGKQKRKELLEALQNAARPSKSGTGQRGRQTFDDEGGGVAASPSSPSSGGGNAPEELRLEVIMPDAEGPTPMVREGTIFGTPKRGPGDERADT